MLTDFVRLVLEIIATLVKSSEISFLHFSVENKNYFKWTVTVLYIKKNTKFVFFLVLYSAIGIGVNGDKMFWFKGADDRHISSLPHISC